MVVEQGDPEEQASLYSRGEGGHRVQDIYTGGGQIVQGVETKREAAMVLGLVRTALSRLARPDFWLDRFPCGRWARHYGLQHLTGDVIAGLTTALTVIPQGIGYAPLAGLPLQYGLYASIIPGFIYCIFGTTKEATIGPTAVNSIMSYNYASPSPSKAAMLGLCAGVVELLAGLLNLGFLLQFVSSTVITAFSSAVAIQVITSQVKGLFGLAYRGRGFIPIWYGLFRNITSTHVPDLVASIIGFLILYLLRKLKELKVCEGEDAAAPRALVVRKLKWLLSISANCIVLLAGSVAAFALLEAGHDVLIITGEVEGGLPPFQLPWYFGIHQEDHMQSEGNRSISELNATLISNNVTSHGLLEIVQELGVGVLMLPLVSLLQHLAIAKHYAGSGTMKASQEMIALGLCQIFGSFTGSMSITASFGRSAVNASSGVRTPFGGVITGLIILLTCAMLSPYLAFIPTSVLSAVIIFSMFSTIDIILPFKLAKARRIEVVPYCVTFLLGLFLSVESGLIIGTLVHSLIVLYLSTRLRLRVESTSELYTLISPDREVFYPSAEHLRSALNRALERGMPVILDLSCSPGMDHTSTRTIVDTLRDCRVPCYLVAPHQQTANLLAGLASEQLTFTRSVEEAVSLINSSGACK